MMGVMGRRRKEVVILLEQKLWREPRTISREISSTHADRQFPEALYE